ncbi:MAG: hypothetical protein GY869_31740 [Planctomycetes bacterium]|nr:hypothetical protein [Planctomycetota bacterium]
MNDLYLALFVMTLIGILLFIPSYLISKKLKLLGKRIFAAITIAALVCFDIWLLDSRLILQCLPFQAAIVYGNLLIPLAAILAGILMTFSKPLWRRIIFSLPIVFVAYGFNLQQIVRKTPPCGDKWKNEVCLQTRESSCSAAATATLLRHHDIDTNEREMAELCLTTEKGTYLHGLYRGLKIKTKDLPIKVQIGSADIDFLRKHNNLPLIISVKLTEQMNEWDPRYARDWGWIVGVEHTAVFFGFASERRVDIGDPGTGRELWDLGNIEDLWQGQYICLKRTETK